MITHGLVMSRSRMYSNKLVTKQQIRGRRWLLKRLALKQSKQEAIAMAMAAAVMDELGGTGHCCWAWPAVQGYDRMRIDAAGRQSFSLALLGCTSDPSVLPSPTAAST